MRQHFELDKALQLLLDADAQAAAGAVAAAAAAEAAAAAFEEAAAAAAGKPAKKKKAAGGPAAKAKASKKKKARGAGDGSGAVIFARGWFKLRNIRAVQGVVSKAGWSSFSSRVVLSQQALCVQSPFHSHL